MAADGQDCDAKDPVVFAAELDAIAQGGDGASPDAGEARTVRVLAALWRSDACREVLRARLRKNPRLGRGLLAAVRAVARDADSARVRRLWNDTRAGWAVEPAIAAAVRCALRETWDGGLLVALWRDAGVRAACEVDPHSPSLNRLLSEAIERLMRDEDEEHAWSENGWRGWAFQLLTAAEEERAFLELVRAVAQAGQQADGEVRRRAAVLHGMFDRALNRPREPVGGSDTDRPRPTGFTGPDKRPPKTYPPSVY